MIIPSIKDDKHNMYKKKKKKTYSWNEIAILFHILLFGMNNYFMRTIIVLQRGIPPTEHIGVYFQGVLGWWGHPQIASYNSPEKSINW